MRKLLFINPELQEGVQVTVRAGRKWLDARLGEELSIARTGDEEVELARCVVRGLAHCRCDDIPQEVLVLEHDPACRVWRGLLKAMVRAYPGFTLGDPVTVVFFDKL